MIWVIILKTVASKWITFNTGPRAKYVKTFNNKGEALELVRKYPELMERFVSKHQGLRIVKIKYIRHTIRPQDVLEEVNDKETINIIRREYESGKNNSKQSKVS